MKNVSVLFLVVVASVSLTGQRFSRLPGTIRLQVTIVLVPTIVLDRDGRPVLGLKDKDFLIKEDGVPQDPFLFSLESHGGEPKDRAPGPSQPEPERKSDPAFENSHHRTFLLVMDRGRNRRFNTSSELIHFLRTGLQVAVPDGRGVHQPSEQTTEGWYLLGYIPQKKAHDGGFRRIDVQVRRDGLRVEHRRGYYAEGPEAARLLTLLQSDGHGLERF